MLQTILNGPKSLIDKRKWSGQATVADLWNVSSVTPGAIALIAVLVS